MGNAQGRGGTSGGLIIDDGPAPRIGEGVSQHGGLAVAQAKYRHVGCNRSSCPTRTNRMTGDALTTQSVTTADLLLEFFEVHREQLGLGPRRCFQKIAVCEPGQPRRLTGREFSATAQ